MPQGTVRLSGFTQATMLEIYAYAVCFVTVLCLMVAVFNLLSSLHGVFRPRFCLNSYDVGKHLNNETFWAATEYRGEVRRPRPSEAELTRERESSFAEALARQSQSTRQSLVQNTLFVLVAATLFGIHWQLAHSAHSQVMRGSSWGRTAS